jgi:hypothetical protein
MEHEKKRISIDLIMKRKDAERLESFLNRTGRNKAPWVRTLILHEMDREEGLGDGSSQAREMKQAIGACQNE